MCINAKRMDDEKLVLKTAQAVWAANKYFVLACSQQNYQKIRQHLRPDVKEFNVAYQLMEETDSRFRNVPSGQLPQIINALQHIAGYFKKQLPAGAKHNLNVLIRKNPSQAIRELEQLAGIHHVDYLLYSRLWERLRERPFHKVPYRLKHQSKELPQSSLYWMGDHVVCQV
ncbi:hypothetical protein GCM10009001_14270 [Virgibacillus siamensis]|uniref:DUF1722 domain-containing protein n=1 Tax=Virgibacillus siamensis TaxID=480071 RepID=A0ABN1FWA9_9BACI